MFFKNLIVLCFSESFHITAEKLEEALNNGKFIPCSSIQAKSIGWVPPIATGKDSPLAHAVNGCYMICLQHEEKILPASVINEALAEKIAEAEERKGSPIGRNTRNSIRDEIIHDLLPRAFSHTKKLYAYIDTRNGWLIVNTASFSKAEELQSWLRRCLGSLPVLIPAVNHRPAAIMTGWLEEEVSPAGFTVEYEFDLKSIDEEGGSIRCKNQNPTSEVVKVSLYAGKEVVKLALTYKDRLSFVLHENLVIKRLKFLDLVIEKAYEIEAEDASQRFDADFSIMAEEISDFIPALFEAFGGLAQGN